MKPNESSRIPRPTSIQIQPCTPLRGRIHVPGDKSISHRIAMLAATAIGRSTVRGFLTSEDCMHTLRAMTSLGADIRLSDTGELEILGTGGKVLQPAGPLDLGNSGTGIRLLTGLLSGHAIEATLTGDPSLCSRPMGRIADPLRTMGARIELTGARGTAPIRMCGGRLHGLDYEMPVASAQVKSALLLAALWAEGETRILERLPTRDHTERLFTGLGLPIHIEGRTITLTGGGAAGPGHAGGEWTVPGDFSSAAFWLVAAASRPDADITVMGVGLNPRRTALLDVLRRMGAEVHVTPKTGSERWEPYGDITVRGAALHGTEVGGDEVPNLIDELPLIAVAGALSEGDTIVRDAAELKVKESDRISSITGNLQRIGVEIEARPDGFLIHGRAHLNSDARMDSFGDHRIAMAMTILAGAAPGPTTICGIDCIDTSYPGFWDDLKTLGGVASAW